MKRRLRLAATAAFLTSLVSTSALAENRTTIQIATVLASNDGRVFDSRLASLKNELRQLRFKSYKLVSSETRVLHGNGGQSGMELPHGRYLHITTREHTPDHLRLHILLNEDNRPVVNTYVKLELGSVVLLGGPRDPDGTLVITIGSRPYREDDGDEDAPRKSADLEDKPTLSPNAMRDLPPIPPPSPAPAVSASSPAH
ncbi:MAG TPA: hypothetical protein VN634_17630 [Candidatus Limnocylindrales bacterium]|nr:hypothetical protein [Candidatus Limnocylindrales bacterium]